ncbi:MAG: hypothetical protein AB7D05_02320 [Mangrovibacterium sp.]
MKETLVSVTAKTKSGQIERPFPLRHLKGLRPGRNPQGSPNGHPEGKTVERFSGRTGQLR